MVRLPETEENEEEQRDIVIWGYQNGDKVYSADVDPLGYCACSGPQLQETHKIQGDFRFADLEKWLTDPSGNPNPELVPAELDWATSQEPLEPVADS